MKILPKLKNRLFVIFLAVLILAIAASVAIINTSKAFSNDSNSYAEHVPGEVIAWLATDSYSSPAQANDLQNNDNASLRAQANSKINEFLPKYDCTTLACYAGDDETYSNAKNDASFITVKNPLLNANAASSNTDSEIPVQERVVKIKFNESQNTMSNIIAELEKNPIVKFAEPNYICSTDGVGDLTQYQYASDTEDPTTTTHNKAGMNVEGWDVTDNITTGTEGNVVAAVIDGGVDIDHPDIPFAGTDGGYNLQAIGYGGKYGFNAGAEDPYSEEAKNPDDTQYLNEGHGTHVAGCIAAKWNGYSQQDNKGVSGVASKCYILPIRHDDKKGAKTTSAYVRATTYLIAQKTENNVNIKVVNNSWSGPTSPSYTMNECTTKTGIAGIISLFASSNKNTNIDIEPNTTASFINNPYVIKVDSTNENGYKSAFSNYGVRTTDVCAPGTNILSTLPTKDLLTAEGKTDNVRTSDTRVLTKDEDYTLIDDFENGQSTNLEYTSYASKQPLQIVGSDTDKKGYESIHAIGSVANTENFVLKGDLSKYYDKTEGAINNISFLYNTYAGNKENDNVVSIQIYDLSATQPKMIYNQSLSTACSGYITYSFPASSLSSLENANILIGVAHFDENLEPKPVEAYLDNIAMAHVDMPYGYMSGTSMATPDCAGVAAVVANTYSNEPIEKVVARVKGGTTHKDWLKDVCYTGGIANLKRSLSDESVLDPVVQSANMTSSNGVTIVELTGYFLGDSNSKVTINGQQAAEVAFTKKSGKDVLTCTFANPITGEAKITVNKNGYSLTRYMDIGDSSNLLETLPLPPKNDAQFDDYYRAFAGMIISASDNIVCVNTPTEKDSKVFYKYDVKNSKWALSKLPAKIKESIGDNYKYDFLNSKDNIIYFNITDSEVTKGILRYDIEKDEVVDFAEFSVSPTIKNTKWLIIEDGIIYLGAYNNDANDVYAYNYNDKTLNQINTGLNCGIKPNVFKQSDNHYVFIDNGDYLPASSGPSIADVYYVTLDDSGFSSEKSSIQAYPEQTKAFSQKTHIAYAYWNGQIIACGPAEFETTSSTTNEQHLENYGYVVSDSYSIDPNTGVSTALPKAMSHHKVSLPYAKGNNNTVYASFVDIAGTIQISKRVLDIPPSPKPPTPEPGEDTAEPVKLSSAATGDVNSGLLTLAIFASIIAGCFIAYSCRTTKNWKLR